MNDAITILIISSVIFNAHAMKTGQHMRYAYACQIIAAIMLLIQYAK